MLAEVVAAVLLGALALWLVLWPMFTRTPFRPRAAEPPEPEETARGVALTALKEIEFDRETGKLSDTDYEFLKAKYTGVALEALRHEGAWAGEVSDDVEIIIAAKVRALRSASTLAPSDAPVPSTDSTRSCRSCGPRPEPDAVFCSTCGRPLHGRSAYSKDTAA